MRRCQQPLLKMRLCNASIQEGQSEKHKKSETQLKIEVLKVKCKNFKSVYDSAKYMEELKSELCINQQ